MTTEQLRELYGYDHAPRAARDVRELGFPLKTTMVKDANGRRMAAYEFDDPEKARFSKLTGRTQFEKTIRAALVAQFGAGCMIHREPMDEKKLQIDHRIPFQVGGDDANSDQDPANYMLLSPSANRQKSWACEHCQNWLQLHNPDICVTCYWAFPDSYEHVAMEDVRRVDIEWRGKEVEDYNALNEEAAATQQSINEYIKEILEKHVNEG